MTVYYFVLLALVSLYLLSRTVQFRKYTGLFVLIGMGILIAVSGLRYEVGVDYPAYVILYEHYKAADFSLFCQPALSLIAMLSSCVMDDYAAWFFLMAALTGGFVGCGIARSSSDAMLSLLFFVVMGMWHGSFNGVKQYAAVAIVFWAHTFIAERRLWSWSAACLAASLFHFSALLMLPMYFFARRRLDAWLLAAIGAFGLFVWGWGLSLFDVAAFLKGGEDVTTAYSENGSRDVHILRVLVQCCVPALYLFLRYVDKGFDHVKMRTAVFFSLLNAVLFVAAQGSVYLLRFCLYTDVYNILLLPYALTRFKASIRFFLTAAAIALYGVFWYVDLAKTPATAEFRWIFQR